MDDNEKAKLLAEIDTARNEQTPIQDLNIVLAYSSSSSDRSFADGYLSHKRRYEQAPALSREDVETIVKEYRGDPRIADDLWNALKNAPPPSAPEPVKTHWSFEECAKYFGWTPENIRIRREAWNAALANALPVQQTGRFEVEERAMSGGDAGTIVFKHDNHRFGDIADPKHVRPAPQTVDLTTEEKVRAINEKSGLNAFDVIDRIQGGKTLDELCREYQVETTRRM